MHAGFATIPELEGTTTTIQKEKRERRRTKSREMAQARFKTDHGSACSSRVASGKKTASVLSSSEEQADQKVYQTLPIREALRNLKATSPQQFHSKPMLTSTMPNSICSSISTRKNLPVKAVLTKTYLSNGIQPGSSQTTAMESVSPSPSKTSYHLHHHSASRSAGAVRVRRNTYNRVTAATAADQKSFNVHSIIKNSQQYGHHVISPSP